LLSLPSLIHHLCVQEKVTGSLKLSVAFLIYNKQYQTLPESVNTLGVPETAELQTFTLA